MHSEKHESLSWEQVDGLIAYLIPKFRREYEAMLMITRGGIVPGGMLAEAMGITHILTAAVDFPAEYESHHHKLHVWPQFIQFPSDDLLLGHSVLIVDDVWGSGRTITAVKNRISAAGGFPSTCVLHFNPNRNLFGAAVPDYYAAVTNAHIVYPWEIDRGINTMLAGKG